MRDFDIIFGYGFMFPLIMVLIALVFVSAISMGNGQVGYNEEAVAVANAREAEAEAAKAQAWAGNMPLILLVSGGVAALCISVWWRGKATVEQIKAQPSDITVNILPADAVAMLEAHAKAQNKRIEQDQGQYYLIDNATGKTELVKPKGLLT